MKFDYTGKFHDGFVYRAATLTLSLDRLAGQAGMLNRARCRAMAPIVKLLRAILENDAPVARDAVRKGSEIERGWEREREGEREGEGKEKEREGRGREGVLCTLYRAADNEWRRP